MILLSLHWWRKIADAILCLKYLSNNSDNNNSADFCSCTEQQPSRWSCDVFASVNQSESYSFCKNVLRLTDKFRKVIPSLHLHLPSCGKSGLSVSPCSDADWSKWVVLPCQVYQSVSAQSLIGRNESFYPVRSISQCPLSRWLVDMSRFSLGAPSSQCSFTLVN